MTWVFSLILLGIGIPNLYKCLSVLGNFISFLPMYLQEVNTNPALLDNEESRNKIRDALLTIFYSIQAHGLNVVILVILGWWVWKGQIPSMLWEWKGFSLVLALWGIGANGIMVNHLIKRFRHAQETQRALEELASSLKSNVAVPKVPMIIWGYIGGYVASGLACGSLLYLLWI
jgi:hypothetical protein